MINKTLGMFSIRGTSSKLGVGKRFLTIPICRMSSSPDILQEEVNGKGVLILNRPKIYNALTLDMMKLIHRRLREWEKSKSLVMIKGAGDKAFCCGGDVVPIVKTAQDEDAIGKFMFREEYTMNYLIGNYRIPFIPLMDGIIMGGGVGLAIHSRYRVVTERTVFAMPEVGIGLFPDVAAGYFLPRLAGHLGKFIGLTGYQLKGWDVLKAGLGTHACDSARIGELETALLKLESTSHEDVSAVLDDFHKMSMFSKDEPLSLEPVLPKIESCFSGSSIEEIVSSLERDESEWGQKQLSVLGKKSPTSLKIALELMKRGANLNLQETLVLDLRIANRRLRDHDFYEGVRALLIDKDQKPKWSPATLDAVTPELVSSYFAPLPPEEELKLDA